MIYIVELNFSDPARETEWAAWYETYLKKLVALPGLNTAQRFKAVAPGAQQWAYLALYSIASLNLYDTDAYRNIGGGGNASARFKKSITRRRNVYAGIERMPLVTETGRVLLCEDAPEGFDLPDTLFRPLEAATGRRQAGASEFDGEPARRALAVSDAATVDRLDLTAIDGLAVYAPITKRHAPDGLCDRASNMVADFGASRPPAR
jgi:hypothetical protein